MLQNVNLYRKGEFALYLDESGSPKPDPNDSARFFAIGGVLIERNNEDSIKTFVAEFKSRWSIADEIPLHASEIRS